MAQKASQHAQCAGCLTSPPISKCCRFWQRKLEDKLLSRAFAAAHGVPVPELLWHGSNPTSIPFSILEARRKPYIVKSSLGDSSHQVLMVKNGVDMLHGRNPVSHADIINQMQRAQKKYPNAKVMIEAEVEHWDQKRRHVDKGVYIYRLFVKGSHVAAIMIDTHNTGKMCDGNWKALPFFIHDSEKKWAHMPLHGIPPAPLAKQLFEYAARLGKAYKTWVRVDFFLTPHGPVFNEYSQTPHMGYGFTDEGSDYLIRELKMAE